MKPRVAPAPWPPDSEVEAVLGAARRAALAVLSPGGPHTTPLACARHGGRLWFVTPRRSLKARVIGGGAPVAAVLEHEHRTVLLGGRAAVVDPLRPGPRLLRALPAALPAALRYGVRQAGEVALLARAALADLLGSLDTTLVEPRVLIGVAPTWGALLAHGRLERVWGDARGVRPLQPAPRAPRWQGGRPPGADRLPGDLADLALGRGRGIVTLEVAGRPVALPCDWHGAAGQARVDLTLTALLPSRTAVIPACVTLLQPERDGMAGRAGLVLRGVAELRDEADGTVLALDAARASWWRGAEHHTVRLRAPERVTGGRQRAR